MRVYCIVSLVACARVVVVKGTRMITAPDLLRTAGRLVDDQLQASNRLSTKTLGKVTAVGYF